MSFRFLGFVITLGVLAVLLGSLLLGLRGEAAEGGWVAVSAPTVTVTERVRVEVLNSARIPGLARDVTERLRREGFDVVYYGNAGRLARDSTTILDRTGTGEAAARVAAALGVERIELAVDTTLYLEATVVLAPDFVDR